jgi:hypothetical protein
MHYFTELNFIEFFWGAVKQWLRENCDYTFVMLQENLLTALASVGTQTIWKWEHHMIRWMQAYRSGLSAKDTQFQVKHFSSKVYNLHRACRKPWQECLISRLSIFGIYYIINFFIWNILCHLAIFNIAQDYISISFGPNKNWSGG